MKGVEVVDRHPAVKCIRTDCPWWDTPHYVERVPHTDVRLHYSVDRVDKVITVLWIHEDSEPWPNEEERQRIRADDLPPSDTGDRAE